MILNCNLSDVIANGKKIKSEAVLSLTSTKLKGSIFSSSSLQEISNFFEVNKFSAPQILLVETIFAEAKQNKFIIKIQFSK